MKPRLISWTMAALLITALGLGCAGSDNNPFGSSAGGSGGGGGGGGGTPGTLAMQVLANNVQGGYNGLTFTVVPLAAGVADPLSGDPTSTLLDMTNSNTLSALFCPFPGTAPQCNQTSLYATFAMMSTWTLTFDMQIAMALNNVDSITLSWGPPPSCSQTFNLPVPADNSFHSYSISPAQFNNNGCTAPTVPYVNNVFAVTVLRRGTPLAGDAVYFDNIRWVH